jgi:hypothetical protein
MTINIVKETTKEIVGELEEVKKDLRFFPKKQNKKYKVIFISISENKIILEDSDGNGCSIPFLGNEHLKINDETKLPE